MSSDLSSNPSLGKEPESDTHRETFLYPITGWLEATSKGVSPSTSLGRFCPAEIRDELYRRHEVFTSKIGYGSVNTADSSALKEMRALWKRPRTRSRAVGLWQAKITSAASEAFTFETPSWLVRPEVLQRDQFTSRVTRSHPRGVSPLGPTRSVSIHGSSPQTLRQLNLSSPLRHACSISRRPRSFAPLSASR
jgi:hypothetical protein